MGSGVVCQKSPYSNPVQSKCMQMLYSVGLDLIQPTKNPRYLNLSRFPIRQSSSLGTPSLLGGSNNSRLLPKLFLLSLCLRWSWFVVFFVFYVFITALYIFHWVLLVFLFLGLIFFVSCHLSCFYSILSSSIFISASTLCLEVGLYGLLSVVLLLMLVLCLLISCFGLLVFIFLGLLCLLF